MMIKREPAAEYFRDARMKSPFVVLLFILVASIQSPTVAEAESTLERLKTAREHFQKGRYEEAAEQLEELSSEVDATDETSTDKIALYLADSYWSQGRREQAQIVLTNAIEKRPAALLWGQLAKVMFDQGRYDEAESAIKKSLELDQNELRARLVQAKLYTERGELKKADLAYHWFVRFYNQHQPTDPESLVLVAQGASQYALWHSSSQILDFCLNTVSVDALKADKNLWQAHWISGCLLLEKYNKAQGRPELKSALGINPNAVEVHVELAKSAIGEYDWDEVEQEGQRALEICPLDPAALRALATAKLYFRDVDAAESLLNDAIKINPIDSHTLALIAALRMLQDGWPQKDRWNRLIDHLDTIKDVNLENPTRCEQIVIEVAQRNPKPGLFLTYLADAVDLFRQHSVAEPLLKQAVALMPQLSRPKNALGQLYMQTGRIEDARRTFDVAFKADPYHVRVSNMRKVIKVLDDYDSTMTDHFVVRADGKLDKLLARYMAEYLEEVYPELTQLFGFEPQSRTQIEIYNTAKGLSGHQWFSARMVGLPWVQTIGASTGVIVAMQSPGSMDRPLNWARVLKHEFVHVLTLQQTEFNIPHWFTEALAVRSEGYPRPVEWNRLLLDRVPKGELKNLDNLTMGFIRAGNQENWNFAYCQSLLYAEYMVKRFGEDSLARLLDAYRRNRTTNQAIPEVFGVPKEDFEKGYREYLDQVVAGIQKSSDEPEQSASQIEKAYEKNKKDPKAAANYARLLLYIKHRNDARELAEEVLKVEPSQPVAAGVLAYLFLRDEKFDDAAKVLEPALDQEHPNKVVIELLMKTRLKQKQAEEAIRLCELGKKHFPYESDWWRGIASASKLTGDLAKRRDALKTLVMIEADDPAPRKALTEMALADQDFDEAYQYARLALHIDVLDADIHRQLANSLHGRKEYSRAISEYEVALELKADDIDSQIGLAETYLATNQHDEAKSLITAILKKDEKNDRAKKLQSQLK